MAKKIVDLLKKKGIGFTIKVKFGGPGKDDRKRCKVCGRIRSAHFNEDHDFKEAR